MEHDWNYLQTRFVEYVRGDAGAAQEVCGVILKVLQRFFMAKIRSLEESEDLAQATLLKIHFARERFDPEQSLKTWVFTIGNRVLIDHWRARSKPDRAHAADVMEIAESEVDDTETAKLGTPERLVLKKTLEKGMAKLKPIERDIVYLYAVEGFTMREIADVHGLSEGAIKVRAHRVWKKLRDILGPEFNGP